MKIEKAKKRDKKRSNKYKMGVDGKSIFIIQSVMIKKSQKIGEKLKNEK